MVFTSYNFYWINSARRLCLLFVYKAVAVTYFFSLKKSCFLKLVLLVNFWIQWYSNFLNLLNISMMLNKSKIMFLSRRYYKLSNFYSWLCKRNWTPLTNKLDIFQETPKFGSEDSQQDVQEKLQHMRSMLTFLEACR